MINTDADGDPVEEWNLAVDLSFNVTHWPYIHDPDTYHCVQKFFSDSFINMSLDDAILRYKVSLFALLVGFSALNL